MSARKTGQSLVNGALILAFSSIVVKILSAFYKIELINIIKEEVFGIYFSAYVIYGVLLTMATAGLPIAISKMIATANAKGRFSEPGKILKIAVLSYMIISAAVSVMMFVFAGPISSLLKNPPSEAAIKTIAPAIFFVCVVSALKGFFQGYKNMVPTAVGNIIESLIKMIAGFTFAFLFINLGLNNSIIAAGAIAGATLGSVLSFLYMIIAYKKNKVGQEVLTSYVKPLPGRVIAKEFFKISVPILFGAMTINVASLIDAVIIMDKLVNKLGMTISEANTLSGSYNGMAVSLFNLPSVIILALGTSLLPSLAESFARRDKASVDKTINTSFRFACIVLIPASLGLSVMSGPILSFLFGSSPDGVKIAAPLLTILAIGVFPANIAAIGTSMLQAVGKQYIPVRNIFIAALVKAFINSFLIGIPSVGITGAPVGTLVCFSVLAVMNIYAVKKYTNAKIDYKASVFKPFLAALACVLTAFASYRLLENSVNEGLATLISLAAGGFIYAILLIFIKSITKEDINLLYKTKKIEKILEKRG